MPRELIWKLIAPDATLKNLCGKGRLTKQLFHSWLLGMRYGYSQLSAHIQCTLTEYLLKELIFTSDVDECSEIDDPCSVGETCMNIQGGYSCECKQGYFKKDGACVEGKL